MPAVVRELMDDEGNKVYPVTKASAAYMKGGKVSVETVLDDMKEAGTKVEFLENGNIQKTLASGNIATTEFLVDGSIKETTTDPDGNKLSVKTTTFGTDGSININIAYEGEEQEENV